MAYVSKERMYELRNSRGEVVKQVLAHNFHEAVKLMGCSHRQASNFMTAPYSKQVIADGSI